MELYEEILAKRLASERMEIAFPDLRVNAAEIVQMECYKVLQKIKAIMEDDSLDDGECFMRIEKIICAFEDAGSSGGFRHDFG